VSVTVTETVGYGHGQPCWVVSFEFGGVWSPVIEIHQLAEPGAQIIAVAVADRLGKHEAVVQRNPTCPHKPGTVAFPHLDGSGYVLGRNPPPTTPKPTNSAS
jgi:hypothetical protein